MPTVKSNTRNKKPSSRYRTNRDYDFLQYIRIVFKWAMTNHNLLRSDIEMLLYLYPQGVFSKKTFNEFYKTIGMFQQKAFDKYMDEGWIVIWRPAKGKEHALYSLTTKAKNLCSRMHKMCTGEISISESEKNNKLLSDDGPRINNYYMSVIKDMNNRKKTP